MPAKKKKARTVFVCAVCGGEHVKHQGRCNFCGEWNSLVQEVILPEKPAATLKTVTDTAPLTLAQIESAREPRIQLPDGELNRVLDGGLVPGSLILLGGEPGIGKSTLLLQLALKMSGDPILYVSGEESQRQIKMRAERVDAHNEQLYIYTETALEKVFEAAVDLDPVCVIIDSIQTIYLAELDATPGSMAQVRECTTRIMRFAKDAGVSFFIIGHINKDGAIAGPKILEHIVDTVLEFEGDRHYNYRIVRSTKNRFGATPELGVYEMHAKGLREVDNPSELFLNLSGGEYSGVAAAATLQGSRPLLIEAQALVTPANYGVPQRSATGYDPRRMNMLLAILEKKCGYKLGDKDVFVNLAGGVRLEDPALDLAAACAVVSSLLDLPVSRKICFAAEVGLTGEIRAVSRAGQRVTEAAKLGFDELMVSARQARDEKAARNLKVRAFDQLNDVFAALWGPNAQG